MRKLQEAAPTWLELPSEGPETFQLAQEEPESYWTCGGLYYPHLDTKPRTRWSIVFSTEAEAILDAMEPCVFWKWDGLPPVQVSLTEKLVEAREDGISGVRLKSYQNGEWITVKEWPV